MVTAFIFISIILIASVLQTSTGFGFSIMATPFLLMLYLPYEAIQINIILSLIISVALIWKIKQDIDFILLKRFILGSIAGVPFGILIFASMDIEAFKLVVSILLLLLTLLLILQFRVNETPFRDYLVGGISGLLTTSIGMPGPPLLLYLTGTETKKAKLRATTLAFYLFIYFVSLLTLVAIVGTNKTILFASMSAVPIVLIGMFLGQKFYKRINQSTFRIFTYILLSSTGVYLFLNSIFGK